MPPWTEDELRMRARWLLHSYRQWAGEDLLALASDDDDALRARALFDAPFAVLAHDTRPDPMCIYANAAALAAFELGLADAPAFATSRTVEPAARDERRAALARAEEAGLLRGYSGVRVSTTGRSFRIHDGRIWTVLDDNGRRVGQAATFRSGPG
ncbi:MEKHLA domain-containing protein [Conexibacter woesei]|uniref:MEKHLA domain protein n=1 Tax=Conexibacter woesei (strain DSM 14684 / CCUG 47730 / CIP 108061 / JCM 11494 / NBRC 100937 / ID131577) TaxID=469383 RepID=D3F883_CONWI|nr:MEKHLA domain-containing protein [Conexibacter woesei]ADB48953.1 MEKHLA domain protein [Conexibacter woesei DSM 14684]